MGKRQKDREVAEIGLVCAYKKIYCFGEKIATFSRASEEVETVVK